jgi:hypothetical protein
MSWIATFKPFDILPRALAHGWKKPCEAALAEKAADFG